MCETKQKMFFKGYMPWLFLLKFNISVKLLSDCKKNRLQLSSVLELVRKNFHFLAPVQKSYHFLKLMRKGDDFLTPVH